MDAFVQQQWLHIRRTTLDAWGLDAFVLSGYPPLEDACRFAELVFPRLPRRVRDGLRDQATGVVANGPFGEAVANVCMPRAARS